MTHGEPWQVLADTLLQREALLCRLGEGLLPHDFAGLYIGHDEVDRILAELPGFAGPRADRVADLTRKLEPELALARKQFTESLVEARSGFERLVRRAALDEVDAQVLALLAAVETSPHRMRLVAYFQDNVQLPRLTVASLDRMLPNGSRRVAPDSPLRRAELIELTPDGPWATRQCFPVPRVTWALAGDNSADPTLPPGTRRLPPRDPSPVDNSPPIPVPQDPLSVPAGKMAHEPTPHPMGRGPAHLRDRDPLHKPPAAGESPLQAGESPLPAGESPTPARESPVQAGESSTSAGELLLVAGADADSRLAAVRERWPGTALLACPLPAAPAEWAAVIREAGLGDRAVLLELAAPLDRAAADRIDRATHLSWVLGSARELALDTLPRRPWREIRLESGLADAGDWDRALGMAPDPAYPLTREQLRLAAAASFGAAGSLAGGVRRLAGGHLDGLSVRIRPQRTMADLILPEDQTAQLAELVARYRRRGVVYSQWGFSPLPSTGVVALFSGPSGTGKTLAAEVVAGRLGLDLYKVDLSAVVSKYIGETEKNLERIFGAAAAGDLVLFFDEADSLFGKRSEVSDAHDRYANIEVAYLLQRLESYQGLVVMATNLQRNIDDAFLRRISVAIDFESPDEPQRRQIWQHAFPSSAPVGELDFDFLARQFRVTGGIIRNAALGAAFLAADESGPVTMERVALALKREFQKLGRLRTESEFGRYFDLVNGAGNAEPS